MSKRLRSFLQSCEFLQPAAENVPMPNDLFREPPLPPPLVDLKETKKAAEKLSRLRVSQSKDHAHLIDAIDVIVAGLVWGSTGRGPHFC